MFDTHCHLNFSVFKEKLAEVIRQAKKAGVDYFVVPGTDIETSKKAVEIAEKFKGVYAAVGIHPHHVFKLNMKRGTLNIKTEIRKIESLLRHNKVVAVGEIGLDKHVYQKTKYNSYQMTNDFFKLQKELFIMQLNLANQNKKAVIIHNRQAKDDLLKILSKRWDNYFSERMVFHCCEPDFVGTGRDLSLLEFAKEKKIFIGVDGDVVYNAKKQDFVKNIPLDLLVLETDSPFLSPIKTFPNEPKNLPIVVKFLSNILSVSINRLIETTTENAERLFLKS